MKRYKVGDIVQIRQWDDMVKEFGVNYYGVIRCNNYCSFVGENEKKYCGKKLRILKRSRYHGAKEVCVVSDASGASQRSGRDHTGYG